MGDSVFAILALASNGKNMARQSPIFFSGELSIGLFEDND
jgi:hypothetical protein